jgi:nucleolar protein 56
MGDLGETPSFALFEHAVGYALFRVKEFEELGQSLPEVASNISDVAKFSSVVKLIAFSPFATTEAALENCNAVSEGIVHDDLLNFLEANIPKEKKQTALAVDEPKLAPAISERLSRVRCLHKGPVPYIMRGLRSHADKLLKNLPHAMLGKAQLGLGHSYSRGKVKFNVNRVDNMIIQTIALLDQLDKDINTFCMRIREWYSYHFPELYKIVPDQYKFIKCVQIVKNRKDLVEDAREQLMGVLEDEALVDAVFEGLRTSMGMDISPIDLINIDRFAARVASLSEYRINLQAYLRERMASCAPNLSALIGEQVGARLISHAGSLTNLAKYPASTVQILGAEKALFRALKTKGNTPKYGLLFHSTFIGRAAAKNKGRISRYLANKCSMASRIDSFSEHPVSTFGEHLKQQVEDRLKYFESGALPRKNIDVMHEAAGEAVEATAKAVKKARKRAKKTKKAEGEENETPPASGKKRKMSETEPETETPSGKKNKKAKKQVEQEIPEAVASASEGETPKKKKKKKNKA